MGVYRVFFSCMLVIVTMTMKVHGISDVDAIEAQARRYEVALEAGDIDTVESLYSEDCRVFGTGAFPIRGRAGI